MNDSESYSTLYKASGPRVFPTHAFVEFRKDEIHQSISTRFEAQASRYPKRIAVRTFEKQFTYAELDRVANQVARSLLSHLDEEERAVGILMEQGAYIIASILGILKAGKYYVPLDPSDALYRNATKIKDSKISLLLCDRKNLPVGRTLRTELEAEITLLNYDETNFDGAPDNLPVQVSPDAVAYELYTSGSTGQPKGVKQSHRNVLHNIMKYTNGLHISDADRLTLLSQCSFGASVSDIFGALLNGASLYPFNLKEQGFAELGRLLREEEITIYHSVPSVYRQFLSTLTPKHSFPELRLIKLGGESVTHKDVELYKRQFSRNCLLHVGLGATEMNIIRQYFCDHDTVISGSVVPIGYPVEDTEVALLDENGQPVDPGSPGEIVIKSDYLPIGKGCSYATGDIGFMQPDGCLFHLGRKDFQLKIRGFRVQVTEIELALEAFPGVKQAAVVGREREDGEKFLVGYILPDRVVKRKELQRFLAERLPAYMLPSRYVFLDEMPMTTNGKIDRQRLSKSKHEHSAAECTISTDDGSLEHGLAQVWCKELAVEHVSYDDDFFELGGNSLSMLHLLWRVEKKYGKVISPSVFYRARTVRQLAAIIRGDEQFANIIPIKTTGTWLPVFLIASVDSSAFIFKDLVRHLNPELPIYGLEERFGKVLHCTPDELAAKYVSAVRNVLPGGPFFLIGLSSGGVVVFEMAKQLEDLGLEVPYLAMIDSASPSCCPQTSLALILASLPSWLHWNLRNGSLKARIKRGLKNVLQGKAFDEHPRRNARPWVLSHSPEPYSGKLILYAAKTQSLSHTLPWDRGWSNLVDELEVQKVRGTHISSFREPDVKDLARAINAHIEARQPISVRTCVQSGSNIEAQFALSTGDRNYGLD